MSGYTLISETTNYVIWESIDGSHELVIKKSH